MGRPPKNGATAVESVTLRLTPEDRAVLDALHEHEQQRNEGVSLSDVLRSLVLREAKRLRLAS